MEATIIPPIPNLELAQGRKYHLILTHLLSDPRYLKFFTEQSTHSYVILDNSAHEHKTGERAFVLLDQAKKVRPSEIVLPDHLFDYADTVNRTCEALEFFAYNLTELPKEVQRFMIVPQSNNIRDYKNCLMDLLHNYLEYCNDPNFPKLTIGVSKDFEVWKGGIYALLEDIVFPIREKYCPEGTQIHLLGWGRNLWELKKIGKDFGGMIRSTDSAKPIIYGLHGICLDPNCTPPEYPGRPKDYFTQAIENKRFKTILWNTKVFDSLVK